jgi:hypothetical protein
MPIGCYFGDKIVDMQAKRLSNQLSIYSGSIFVIKTLAIVFSLQACNANKPGAATPDRVIEQYLLALERKDENLMLQLVPENSAVSKAVKAKIGKFGGHKIQDRQIIYTKPTSILWEAKIRGFYLDRDGRPRKFDDSIEIGYQSKGQLKLYAGRWYLLLD